MKLTNKFSLPETFVRALEKKNAAYDSGQVDVSVTQMINSPRIDRLRKRHYADIEKDLSEELWALFGSTVHSILEDGADPNHIVEERLFAELQGWKFSGAIDVQEVHSDNTISIKDFKVTTTFAVMKGGSEPKKEWLEQLNIYKYLVEKNKGVKVKDLTIIAILRDWSSSKAKREELYPKAAILPIPIPMWDYEQTEDFIRSRIIAHQEAEIMDEAGYELPLCSSAEQWETGRTYAIKKPHLKRAASVHPSREEAEAILSTMTNPTQYEIVERDGRKTRCEGNWCQVAPWCTQWQTEKSDEA